MVNTASAKCLIQHSSVSRSLLKLERNKLTAFLTIAEDIAYTALQLSLLCWEGDTRITWHAIIPSNKRYAINNLVSSKGIPV
ncbi:hypothetical protein H5410_026166 [Solanum commersonii]|uniref:Uncharacterized protein n=1 Tax=Solanum commersonii TaxID=4109 RepID=A0A9J5YW96_SOLCO|nr:hypothetical protein H5410_026166 [Solanum commersonii]